MFSLGYRWVFRSKDSKVKSPVCLLHLVRKVTHRSSQLSRVLTVFRRSGRNTVTRMPSFEIADESKALVGMLCLNAVVHVAQT